MRVVFVLANVRTVRVYGCSAHSSPSVQMYSRCSMNKYMYIRFAHSRESPFHRVPLFRLFVHAILNNGIPQLMFVYLFCCQ